MLIWTIISTTYQHHPSKAHTILVTGPGIEKDTNYRELQPDYKFYSSDHYD